MELFRSRLTWLTPVLFCQLFGSLSALGQSRDIDIAPFARRCCVSDHNVVPQVAFDYSAGERAGNEAERAVDGRYIYGLQWAEARDIKEVSVRFRPGSVPKSATVEYWSHNWPDPPPKMPTIEDPEPDPWQGHWTKAASNVTCANLECRYTFQPLGESENPRAKNLPGLDYRRTLKLRLVFAVKPTIDRVEVFSGSTQKTVRLRIELGAGDPTHYEWNGDLRIYNGILKDVKLWNGSAADSADTRHFRVVTEGSKKGLYVDVTAVDHSLPGSEDITIVTLEAGERTFSFALPDLDKGPIYVPAFHAYMTLATDKQSFSPSVVEAGSKIR